MCGVEIGARFGFATGGSRSLMVQLLGVVATSIRYESDGPLVHGGPLRADCCTYESRYESMSSKRLEGEESCRMTASSPPKSLKSLYGLPCYWNEP